MSEAIRVSKKMSEAIRVSKKMSERNEVTREIRVSKNEKYKSPKGAILLGVGIDGTVVAVFEEMPLRIIRRKFFITFGK